MSDGAATAAPRPGRYAELATGDQVVHAAADGTRTVVALKEADERGAVLTVGGARVRLELGHFRSPGDPVTPGEVLSMAKLEGVRVGVDVTRAFMRGTRYSTSLVNLADGADARIYLGEARRPLSPPGPHVFPLPDYTWNFGDPWLRTVPYGWHLGIDLRADRGQPIVSVTDGTVISIRRFDPSHDPDDYWGNGLAIAGDDGLIYIYMHPDEVAGGVAEGERVTAGQPLGGVGRSGFESMPYPPHLHFEMALTARPDRFRLAIGLEPDPAVRAALPTPNRYLPTEAEGHAVNPYPFLVEWYLGR